MSVYGLSILISKEQSTKIGMTESDAQSYVSLEDFSGLTDGNKVDRGATAWSRATYACNPGAACNLHLYIAYKQRNWGIICQTIRS
jgi:hypothetical protein